LIKFVVDDFVFPNIWNDGWCCFGFAYSLAYIGVEEVSGMKARYLVWFGLYGLFQGLYYGVVVGCVI